MDNVVEVYVEGCGEAQNGKLTLVDAAYLAYMMWDYAVLDGRGDLADRIYESLLRHGINVTERLRLLLPVTPNGDIARSYRDLVEMGIACVTVQGGRVILNVDLLEAMKKIAQVAQSRQYATATPSQ